jgi:hypothetical protein
MRRERRRRRRRKRRISMAHAYTYAPPAQQTLMRTWLRAPYYLNVC